MSEFGEKFIPGAKEWTAPKDKDEVAQQRAEGLRAIDQKSRADEAERNSFSAEHLIREINPEWLETESKQKTTTIETVTSGEAGKSIQEVAHQFIIDYNPDVATEQGKAKLANEALGRKILEQYGFNPNKPVLLKGSERMHQIKWDEATTGVVIERSFATNNPKVTVTESLRYYDNNELNDINGKPLAESEFTIVAHSEEPTEHVLQSGYINKTKR